LNRKVVAAAFCITLLFWSSLGLPTALASDPSLGDLSGTDSSDWADTQKSIGMRLDIAGYTGNNGLQAGDDADSLAFGTKLEKTSEHIWMSGNDDNVYKLKKSDPGGTPILSWNTGYTYPFGCEYRLEDGNEYIYIVDYNTPTKTDRLIKYQANSGTEVTNWYIGGYCDQGVGLAWNGSRWFISDFKLDVIHQVNPANPTVAERSFSYAGLVDCHGLAWDGSYLWAVQTPSGNQKVVQIDIYGNIQKSWSWTEANAPTGIAYDTTSGHLWVAAYSPSHRLYEYDTNGNKINEWDQSYRQPQGAAYSSAGFTVAGMRAGDKNETYFTIGTKEFAMFFVATGPSAGVLRLYHKEGASWTLAETHTEGSIGSGTRFESSSGNMAAKLTNSNPSSYGVVKLEVKKSRLTALGATGSSVTNIAGYTYSGSSTTPTGPGQDGGTKRDRCPSGSSFASYTMSTVPEFPLGVLILAIPVTVIYVHLRKRSRVEARIHVRSRS